MKGFLATSIRMHLFKCNVLIDLLFQHVQHPTTGLGTKISFFVHAVLSAVSILYQVPLLNLLSNPCNH